MNCPYCGREVEEGKVFCECGRPVNLAGASGGSSAGPQTDFQQQLNMQTLDSVKAKKAAPILPLIIIIVGLLAVGGVFLLKFIRESNITKEDTWETVTKAEYSVKLPTAMKNETDRMLTIKGSSMEKLDFYTCSKAAFYVTARSLYDAEKEKFGNASTEEIIKQYKTIVRKVNDVEVEPSVRGKYIYYEMEVHRPNYISSSDEVWEIEAYFYTKDKLFEVYAYCDLDEKDKYRESMLKWLDSFEPAN